VFITRCWCSSAAINFIMAGSKGQLNTSFAVSRRGKTDADSGFVLTFVITARRAFSS
jgi:hypothetical protein